MKEDTVAGLIALMVATGILIAVYLAGAYGIFEAEEKSAIGGSPSITPYPLRAVAACLAVFSFVIYGLLFSVFILSPLKKRIKKRKERVNS